jgi:hypothetical protein
MENYMIVQNAIICKECDDFIFSRHRHDFVTCSCGASSVDGGQEYLRRSGDSWLDVSWSIEDEIYRECGQAALDAKNRNCNEYGVANAVMRVLRDYGKIVAEGEFKVMANYKDELMVIEPDGNINRYKKIVD